jgi:hypothetical protein
MTQLGPATTSATRAASSSRGTSIHPGRHESSSRCVGSTPIRSAIRRATVVFPAPHAPTTQIR